MNPSQEVKADNPSAPSTLPKTTPQALDDSFSATGLSLSRSKRFVSRVSRTLNDPSSSLADLVVRLGNYCSDRSSAGGIRGKLYNLATQALLNPTLVSRITPHEHFEELLSSAKESLEERDYAEAAYTAKEAMLHAGLRFGERDLRVGYAAFALSEAKMAGGDLQEALEKSHLAYSILAGHPGMSHKESSDLAFLYAKCLLEAGNAAPALGVLHQALDEAQSHKCLAESIEESRECDMGLAIIRLHIARAHRALETPDDPGHGVEALAYFDSAYQILGCCKEYRGEYMECCLELGRNHLQELKRAVLAPSAREAALQRTLNTFQKGKEALKDLCEKTETGVNFSGDLTKAVMLLENLCLVLRQEAGLAAKRKDFDPALAGRDLAQAEQAIGLGLAIVATANSPRADTFRANLLFELGMIKYDQGKFQEAAAVLELALDIPATAQMRPHVLRGSMFLSLAGAYIALNRKEEAEMAVNEAKALLFPTDDLRADLLMIHSEMAKTLRELGRPSEALAVSAGVAQGAARLFGEGQTLEKAQLNVNLARFHLNVFNIAEAQDLLFPLMRQLEEYCRNYLPEEDENLVPPYPGTAGDQEDREYSAAEPAGQGRIEEVARNGQLESIKLDLLLMAAVYETVSDLHKLLGETGDALSYISRSLRIREVFASSQHAQMLMLRAKKAHLLLLEGEGREADQENLGVAADLARRGGHFRSAQAFALYVDAEIQKAAGDTSRAAELIEQSTRLFSSAPCVTLEAAQAWNCRGLIHRALFNERGSSADGKEAYRSFHKADAHLKKAFNGEHPFAAVVKRNIAGLIRERHPGWAGKLDLEAARICLNNDSRHTR